MGLREQSHLAGQCSRGEKQREAEAWSTCLLCRCRYCTLDIYCCSDGLVSHGRVVQGGKREMGSGREAAGVGWGWWWVSGIVVGQDMGAAAASSFALVLCSKGRLQFQSSLAGARRGQVVTVLVLGPKPQPLLVLFLWFFGSVLPWASWNQQKKKRLSL